MRRARPPLPAASAGGRLLARALASAAGRPSSSGVTPAAYAAALAAEAASGCAPGPRVHYDPRYYAANVLDPDGYCLEFVFKSWQHPR